MSADATPHLALAFLAESQQHKEVTLNEALNRLDAVVQLAVLDRDLAAPPASPEEGDRYLVAAGGSGAWSGADGMVAAFFDGAWTVFAPAPGWVCWIADEKVLLVHDGTAWQVAGGGTSETMQNLALLGLGTAADATNPFSAKLNCALWTAKTTAEGGSGDLRYVFNKEAAANTSSLLFQTGFAGRAEIGLAGDDDLHLKVSPDGSAWREALVVDHTSGAMRLTAPTTIQIDDGTALSVDLEEGDGVFQATRYADSSNAPVFFGRKARGTRAAPAAVQAGDTLIGFRGYGYTGTQFVDGAKGVAFLLEAAENWVDGAAYGTQIRLFTTDAGTVANVERLRIAASGDLQMGGANTVINASRHPVLRAYTVATLPAASPEGQLVYVADGSSNRRLAVSDGVGWRFPDGSLVT